MWLNVEGRSFRDKVWSIVAQRRVVFSCEHFSQLPPNIHGLKFLQRQFLFLDALHLTLNQHSRAWNEYRIRIAFCVSVNYHLMSFDISSMTESNCWYLVWDAGSRAPLVGGSWESEGAGPVGVEDWGGLDSERSDDLAEGVVGVLDLELL